MKDDFLEIDQHALDKEWLSQPKKVFKYAQDLAHARKTLDEAKTELDLAEAELDKTIRNDPGEFGIEKLTEKTVQAAIKEQKEYQAAQKELLEAKHAVDILAAAVNALEHRKRALESLVTLHGQQYFSSPSVKASSGEDMTASFSKAKARTKHQRPRRKSEDS